VRLPKLIWVNVALRVNIGDPNPGAMIAAAVPLQQCQCERFVFGIFLCHVHEQIGTVRWLADGQRFRTKATAMPGFHSIHDFVQSLTCFLGSK
jgi:hypothetical protein